MVLKSPARRWALWLVAVLLPLIPVGTGQAATGSWTSSEIVPGEYLDARLLSAVDAVGSLAAVPAGLQIRLDPGWKTYWRSPGDAGLPPTVDWAGSTNLAGVTVRWPAPHRFTLFDLDTFGYADGVLLPLEVRPADPGLPVKLRGTLSALVCTDICVPVTAALSLDLPAGPAVPDARAANLIDQAVAQVPGDGAAVGLAIDRIEAGTEGLAVAARARDAFDKPDILVEAPDGWVFGPPRLDLAAGGHALTAMLPVVQRPTPDAALAGLPVTLTLVDGARGMEQAAAVAVPVARPAAGLWAMLLTALAGGLILNLMPCVLPVLSLKLLSVLGHAGRSPGRARLGFLAAAAGIVVSFMLLAAAAIAARAAGMAVGWGIQFQQPVFLVAMTGLVTLFACNLLGLFEIRLPGAIATGAGRAGGTGLAGDFATGAFAALLATPCSAPFLGTAVGFALSRHAPDILLVFLALGLGLALPYLLVAALPRLLRLLPRPGRWMLWLRRVLGLALVATALWLLSVLAVTADGRTALLVGLLMLAAGLLLWARRRLAGRLRLAGALGAAALLAAAVSAPLTLEASATPPPAVSADWTPFDAGRIAGLVASGRTVFVDVTADWCLTCQANKLLVLDRDPVAARLNAPGMVAMRADWTRPDEGIARFLAAHGRYGIPFNIVYGPGAPDGIVLSELLRSSDVLAAMDGAKG